MPTLSTFCRDNNHFVHEHGCRNEALGVAPFLPLRLSIAIQSLKLDLLSASVAYEGRGSTR